MARVASRNYYDDDEDLFGNVTEGIKTGMGIAQTYHNIENAKSSRAFNEAQLKDFNRGEASRNAGYDAAEAKSNAEKYKLEQDMKTAYATAATHTIYNAMKMEDQGQAFAHIQREMPTVTNGQFDVSFGQVQGPDGPSNVAQFTTKDGGKAEMYFRDMADFTKQFNNLRQQHGLFTFGERDMARRADIAEGLWKTLTPDEQTKYGSFGEFTKDPRVRDHVDLMATKENSSGAEARQTTKEWDQKDEKHKQDIKIGESQLETEAARQGEIGQRVRFANELHPYDVSVVQSQAQGGKLDVYKKADPVIEDLDPSLTPEWVDVSASIDASMVDPSDPLYQIDQKSGKVMKAIYRPEQEAKRRDIIIAREKIIERVPDIDPVQATEKAVKLVNEEAEELRRRREEEATRKRIEQDKMDELDRQRSFGLKRLKRPQDYGPHGMVGGVGLGT